MTESNIFFDAIRAGDMNTVRRLIHENPALLQHNESGLSPILVAIYNNEPDIADLCIEAGADMNIFEASAAGRLDHVRTLVEEDAELVNAYAPDGFQPLGLAAFFGHPDVVDYLLDSGADPNSPSSNRMRVTPLNSASAASHLDSARTLLDHGANPNIAQADGYTPLHVCAANGNLEMARLLLAYGADPNLQMDDGRTPLDLAREAGAYDIETLLTEI